MSNVCPACRLSPVESDRSRLDHLGEGTDCFRWNVGGERNHLGGGNAGGIRIAAVEDATLPPISAATCWPGVNSPPGAAVHDTGGLDARHHAGT